MTLDFASGLAVGFLGTVVAQGLWVALIEARRRRQEANTRALEVIRALRDGDERHAAKPEPLPPLPAGPAWVPLMTVHDPAFGQLLTTDSTGSPAWSNPGFADPPLVSNTTGIGLAGIWSSNSNPT